MKRGEDGHSVLTTGKECVEEPGMWALFSSFPDYAFTFGIVPSDANGGASQSADPYQCVEFNF